MSQTGHLPCMAAARRLRAFLRSGTGQQVLKGLSLIFTVGLIAYLARQLGEIGWRDVLGRVPRAPRFYIAFIAFYFCFPLFECAIFRLLWNCPARRSLPALLKKRVYSKYLLDYSGEAYMYLWACRHVDLPARQVLHTLKDNIIISSTSSMLMGAMALLGLLCAGQIALPKEMFEQDATYLTAAALVGVVVAALGVKFRRRILWLPRQTAGVLFALHAGRVLTAMVLQVLMWTAVDPAVSLRSWLSLLSVEIVVSRIPFLPHRDFVFLGTGLEVAGALDVALPLLAGMLLTVSMLEKLLNLFFFVFFSFIRRDEVGDKIDPQVLVEER